MILVTLRVHLHSDSDRGGREREKERERERERKREGEYIELRASVESVASFQPARFALKRFMLFQAKKFTHVLDMCFSVMLATNKA